MGVGYFRRISLKFAAYRNVFLNWTVGKGQPNTYRKEKFKYCTYLSHQHGINQQYGEMVLQMTTGVALIVASREEWVIG